MLSNAEEINERGGIFGHQIAVVYAEVSPIGPIAHDEACVIGCDTTMQAGERAI